MTAVEFSVEGSPPSRGRMAEAVARIATMSDAQLRAKFTNYGPVRNWDTYQRAVVVEACKRGLIR